MNGILLLGMCMTAGALFSEEPAGHGVVGLVSAGFQCRAGERVRLRVARSELRWTSASLERLQCQRLSFLIGCNIRAMKSVLRAQQAPPACCSSHVANSAAGAQL